MKIIFKKKYTDNFGKVFKKGSIWAIHDPVAIQLVEDGVAEGYSEPEEVEYVARPSKIVDPKGNKLEVVEERPAGMRYDEDGMEVRSKGKDTK